MPYNTTKPIAGNIVTKKVTAAADQYHVGMPLSYVTANDNYAYNATTIEAVVWEDKTLAAPGSLLVAITGSEILKSGIVDNANAALAVTPDAEHQAMLNGIVLR